jgi:hypothetical protein
LTVAASAVCSDRSEARRRASPSEAIATVAWLVRRIQQALQDTPKARVLHASLVAALQCSDVNDMVCPLERSHTFNHYFMNSLYSWLHFPEFGIKGQNWQNWTRGGPARLPGLTRKSSLPGVAAVLTRF